MSISTKLEESGVSDHCASTAITILIADDHELVREGLIGLLEPVEGVKVIGTASSGEEAIESVKNYTPDVTIMDIQMPGLGGAKAIRALVHEHPDIKILVLTSHDNDVFPKHLIECCGVRGFVTKSCSVEKLVKAIKIVKGGGKYIEESIAQKMFLRNSLKNKNQNPFEALSEREKEVMDMLIHDCKRPKDIAEALGISPKTVDTFKTRLLEKLGVKNVTEMSYLAIYHEIINSQFE